MFNWQDRVYVNARKKVMKDVETGKIYTFELQDDADNISVESETPLTAYNLNQAQQELVDDMSKTYVETNITGDTVAGYGRINKLYGKTTEEGAGEKSPSNPYKLKCIGDDVNLFDGTLVGGTFADGVPNTAQPTIRLRNSSYINVQSNTNYTISAKYANVLQVMIMLYDSSKTLITSADYYDVWKNMNFTFKTTSDTAYVMFVFRDSTNATISLSNISKVKLQKGSVATLWSPYGYSTVENISKSGEQQSSNIVYVDKPLCSIGDVRDELSYTKGKITRRLGIKSLDGTENIIAGGTTTQGLFRYDLIIDTMKTNSSKIISTHFKTTLVTNTDELSTSCISTHISQAKIIFWTNFATLADFKAFLSGQYANGTPVDIVYELATPIEEDIDCSDKIVQYDGQTTVYNRDEAEIEVSFTNNKAISEVNENFKNNEIETITNENGKAIKFPDGTMICMGTSNNGNGSYDTTYHTYTSIWIHPVPFIEPPYVVATVAGGNSVAYTVMTSSAKGSTQTQVKCLGTNGTIQTCDRGANCIAIGRWK